MICHDQSQQLRGGLKLGDTSFELAFEPFELGYPQLIAILGVPSISILSRDPNLSRTSGIPGETAAL